MTAVSQIKTANRRISNIDRLKMELAVRQATMHGGGRKARMKADSSDDNETSDDDDSDSTWWSSHLYNNLYKVS